MKKRISLLAALLILVAAVFGTPAATADITVVQVTKAASVRSAPGFNSDKLALAETGAQYPFLGEESGWYEVQLDATRAGFLPKASCKLVTVAGIPTDTPQAAFKSIADTLKSGKGLDRELPQACAGKAVIAVYSDLILPADEVSAERTAAGAHYREIPDNLLAARMDEADWALLVYAKEKDGTDEPPELYVFPVDVKNTLYYEPYNMDDRATLLSDGEKTTDIGAALKSIRDEVLRPRWETARRLANDADYQAGLKLMGEGKYYSALEAFRLSSAPEAAETAAKCVQTWPATGELWRNPSVKGSNMQLTVKVNQESDQAMLVKIYRSNVHALSLFIAGSGQVTSKLPAGTYVIRDGVGTAWYGEAEAFGQYGQYETLTFGEQEETQVKLQNGHAYTISINPAESSPEAEGVGSQGQGWEGF